jgi:hypothetical protein
VKPRSKDQGAGLLQEEFTPTISLYWDPDSMDPIFLDRPWSGIEFESAWVCRSTRWARVCIPDPDAARQHHKRIRSRAACIRFLPAFFSRAASALAVILIWFATNLLYYVTVEPSMSHACSFFASALFLSLWLSRRPDPTLTQWIILGISGGMVAPVRPPDATRLALPIVDCLFAMKAAGDFCIVDGNFCLRSLSAQ